MLAAVLVATQVLSAPRVVPILHGEHFDDLQKDCELPEACPPVLMAFYSTQCDELYHTMDYHEHGLPDRTQLFMGKYNISGIDEVWWDHSPLTDLAARFNIDEHMIM